jgi:transcription elongation factor GreA
MPRKASFLTPEGREKLLQELEYLRTVKRAEVARNLKAAIEEGDLSENAGYAESKREQAMLEGRIADLEAIIADAVDIETEPEGDRHLVEPGATVTIAENGYEPETYQIVGAAEADPAAGRISNESPLGRALMGHRVGAVVNVSSPGGAMTFKILSIE